MSTPIWEQQPKESDTWYGRFHRYLLLGPERSIDEAFRQSMGGGPDRTDSDRRAVPRRAPGSWKEAALKWEWAKRARAWDDEERARLRRAHHANLKQMNAEHQKAARAVFARSLKAIASASTEGLSLPQAVAVFERAVNIERRVMGEPLGVELIVRGGRPGDSDFDDAIEEASAESDHRFECTPEIYAAVAEIMARHETKPYSDETEAQAPAPAAEPAPPQADELPHASEPAADLEAQPSA